MCCDPGGTLPVMLPRPAPPLRAQSLLNLIALAMLMAVSMAMAGCAGVRKSPGLLEVLAPPPASEVRVVSFNIRFAGTQTGPRSWAERLPLVVAAIRSTSADVLGLQEAERRQIDDLVEALPEYAFAGVGRDDGRDAGEFSPILYRHARFDLLDQRTFWFSDSPQRPGSRGWGANLPRICTTALLLEPSTNRRLRVFNMHWDHQSEYSRLRSAELLAQAIADSRQVGTPALAIGDFNADPESPALAYLLGRQRTATTDTHRSIPASPALLDALTALPANEQRAGTFHNFTGVAQGQRIDHILIDRDLRVRSAFIDRTADGERYPSDHFAVGAVVLIGPAGRDRSGADR
jgi:endonuclease/exonuclease/phosphatase family metal-dependent hydrolase